MTGSAFHTLTRCGQDPACASLWAQRHTPPTSFPAWRIRRTRSKTTLPRLCKRKRPRIVRLPLLTRDNSFVELTTIMSATHDCLYPSEDRTSTLSESGAYYKYVDDLSRTLASFRATWEDKRWTNLLTTDCLWMSYVRQTGQDSSAPPPHSLYQHAALFTRLHLCIPVPKLHSPLCRAR